MTYKTAGLKVMGELENKFFKISLLRNCVYTPASSLDGCTKYQWLRNLEPGPKYSNAVKLAVSTPTRNSQLYCDILISY